METLQYIIVRQENVTVLLVARLFHRWVELVVPHLRQEFK